MGVRRKVLRSRSGKTLEVVAEVSEGRISQLTISGDFMAFPSEAIDGLEEALIGRTAEEVDGIVREALEGVELIGIEVDELIEAIRELVSSRLPSSHRRS